MDMFDGPKMCVANYGLLTVNVFLKMATAGLYTLAIKRLCEVKQESVGLERLVRIIRLVRKFYLDHIDDRHICKSASCQHHILVHRVRNCTRCKKTDTPALLEVSLAALFHRELKSISII